jgi:hypothetical protein
MSVVTSSITLDLRRPASTVEFILPLTVSSPGLGLCLALESGSDMEPSPNQPLLDSKCIPVRNDRVDGRLG